MDDLPKILEGVEGKFIETSRIKIFTRFTTKIQGNQIVFIHGISQVAHILKKQWLI